MLNNASSSDTVLSSVNTLNSSENIVGAKGQYSFECFDADGNLKWSDTADNLVVNTGAQLMNQTFFAGSGYTAAWYVGLINASPSPTFSSIDTMASHAGWAEVAPYNNATRPACSFGTATTANPSVIGNSANVAVFNIGATATVYGAFLANSNTKSGTTGTLLSEAVFIAGSRSVASGDTLQVTYTFNLTSL